MLNVEELITGDKQKMNTEWAGPPKNVHFLILPAYVRYNDAAPLAVRPGVKNPVAKDLLFFPLGYGQAINSLRTYTHHRIEVIDPYAEYVGIDGLENWLDATYQSRHLADPDYVLIGGMSTNWPVVKGVTKIIQRKFPTTRIICGGTIADLHYEILLKKLKIYAAVLGEADFVIVDLFRNLDALEVVPGIAYLDKSGAVIRTATPNPPDLNQVLEPAWDMMNTAEYVNSSKRMVGFKGLPINTSRGCPFSCRFCYISSGRKMRQLTVANVIDRMLRLRDQYHLDYIAFLDDIMFVDKDWMWNLGEAMIKANVGLMWNCSTRVNLFSEKDGPLLRLLRNAGLVRMSFGIETGSSKILKNMGKTGVSPEKARATLRLVRKYDIRATASMLIGFPGETPETIQESVKFCKDNLLYPDFYLLQPFPGTDVYDKYVRETYDEESYLDLIADYREGEKFPINLTEMTDEELDRLRIKAQGEVKRFYFGRYVEYHAWSTPKRILWEAYSQFQRIKRGSLFVTP